MDKLWTIGGPATLIERGNATMGESPVEVSNVYSLSESVVQMRQGFGTESFAAAAGLLGPLLWVGRHVTNVGAEEAWAASNNGGTACLARRSGGTWADATFSDTAAAGNLQYMHAATQNGKLFLAYDSNVNRLHVWDGTSVRRVGLGVATAPTVASIGAGGLGFTRYYRQRNTVQVSGVTVRRSEASTEVNITIAASSGVRVTKGAASGDGETHWEVEAAAAAAGPWYRIGTTAVGTSTFDDTSASIATTSPTDTTGLYVPPPACKYLVTDGAVLLMAGAWESSAATGQTSPFQNRVWFTRPLGATDISDDESVTQTTSIKNWIDIGDAGPITGLSRPKNGEVYVFKASSIWKLVPTGNVNAPYQRVQVSDAFGAVDQRLITEGDLQGVPAIVFADQTDVYALSSGGVTRISEGIARDLRQTTLTAAGGLLVFDPNSRQVLLQVSTSPAAPTGSYRSFLFDCAKQRWSGFSLAGATTGWLLGSSLLGVSTYLGGAGAQLNNGAYMADPEGGRRLYLAGQSDSSTGALFTCGSQVGLDGSTAYTAVARYRKPFAALTGRKITAGCPTLWYRNPQGTTSGTMTALVQYIRDDDEIRSQSFTMDATDDDNGIAVKQKTLESLMAADVSTLDVRVYLSYSGTAFSSVATPTVDCVQVPYAVQEPLAR